MKKKKIELTIKQLRHILLALENYEEEIYMSIDDKEQKEINELISLFEEYRWLNER